MITVEDVKSAITQAVIEMAPDDGTQPPPDLAAKIKALTAPLTDPAKLQALADQMNQAGFSHDSHRDNYPDGGDGEYYRRLVSEYTAAGGSFSDAVRFSDRWLDQAGGGEVFGAPPETDWLDEPLDAPPPFDVADEKTPLPPPAPLGLRGDMVRETIAGAADLYHRTIGPHYAHALKALPAAFSKKAETALVAITPAYPVAFAAASKFRGLNPGAVRRLSCLFSCDAMLKDRHGKAVFSAAGIATGEPVAGAAYLSCSSAIDPVKTAEAARSEVRYAADTAFHRPTGDPRSLIAARLSGADRRGVADWYYALSCAALDATGNLSSAIPVADEAFRRCPENPTERRASL